MATKSMSVVAERARVALGIGKLLGKLATNVFSQLRIKRSYAKQIKALQDERDAKLGPKVEEQEKLVGELLGYLTVHQGAFIKGLKSVTYAVGQVGFRKMKASVELADGYTKQQLIKKLKGRRRSWLRETFEINKQKILQDYQDGKFKKVEGIAIREGDEFFISLAPRGEDKPEVITVPLSQK